MTDSNAVNDLIPVILSGGAGTRLWPISRESSPKPFIKLPDGQSLIEKTYHRALSLEGVAEVADGDQPRLLLPLQGRVRADRQLRRPGHRARLSAGAAGAQHRARHRAGRAVRAVAARRRRGDAGAALRPLDRRPARPSTAT